jgi:hypothetical protein
MTTPPSLLHPPETHHLGALEPKPAHVDLHELVDPAWLLRMLGDTTRVDNSLGRTIELGTYRNTGPTGIGCCGPAGSANLTRVQSGGLIRVADGAVVTGYSAVTGLEGHPYDPATGANAMVGVYLRDLLDWWLGFGLGEDEPTHKIVAHAGLATLDPKHLMAAAAMFGGLFTGWNLQKAQQDQEVWKYLPGSDAWGGHCAPTSDLELVRGGLEGYVLTWGIYKKFVHSFLAELSAERHVVLSQAWIDRNHDKSWFDERAFARFLGRLQPEN